MAKFVLPRPMYTHPEWVMDKESRFRRTELERKDAERLTNEADRFEDETDKRTKRTLDDVNKKIDQRRDDIKYWDNELEKMGEKIFKETDMLRTDATRIDKARSAVKDYRHLTENCRKNRQDRYGIDNCGDDAHFCLNYELGIYENVLKMLDKVEAEAIEQIRRDRKAKYLIDKDSLNKKTADAIESYCLDLKPNSSDTQDVTQRALNKPMLKNEEWLAAVDKNIKNAEAERANSENMRSIIDGILQHISNDMQRAVIETNRAFKRRIDEVVDVKGKDEEHLKRVIQEIKDTETSMEDLKKCLDSKNAYLDLALHRLGQRNQRPNRENVLDEPFIRLNQEICEIKYDIESLKQRIVDHQIKLKGLRRQQISLEEDIESKSNAIFIDQVICMGIRENIVIMSY